MTILFSPNGQFGFKFQYKKYACENCVGCAFANECKPKANIFQPRSIQVCEKLERYKQQARENLNSEEGINIRKQRNTDIEEVCCFKRSAHSI